METLFSKQNNLSSQKDIQKKPYYLITKKVKNKVIRFGFRNEPRLLR